MEVRKWGRQALGTLPRRLAGGEPRLGGKKTARLTAGGEEPGRGQEGGRCKSGWGPPGRTLEKAEGSTAPDVDGAPPGVVQEGWGRKEGQQKCSGVKISAKVTCTEHAGPV